VDAATMLARVAAARVGRLATVTAEGRPHVVPCCFAVDGGRVVTAVDAKPKSTTALRRLDNVRANPSVALLVDHYDDADWSQLWWVRVDGTARVVDGVAEREAALAALAAKYPQYRETPPPGPVVVVEPTAWRSWP
jgi:PPOX class probable F420-dependent enzyme